ncbi:Sec-independent protein translocase subunit TatA/TatB [Deinococcus sp. UYEF24]
MPNLGFPEIMIILVVALLVFGPKKLPDLGKSLGNGIREFRKGTQGLKDELEGSMKDAPATQTPVTQTTAAAPQVVQPPVLSAAQATPTAVILPSAPVVHVIELGKPAVHEEAQKV